jgi:uncharacterized membrane protein
VKDYYDDVEMPGSRLNIRFHGDRGASEQTFIIPFRDGDNIKYFVVRGVMGRQARDEMRHDQDNGLGSADQIPRGYLGGAMGRNAIQAEDRRDFTAILSPVILKERIRETSVVALLMSILGICLISHEELIRGVSGDILGIIYGLLAGLSYAGFIIVSKKLREGQSSLTTAFYSYVFAAIFLAVISRPMAPSLSTSEWILLLILSGVNTCSAVTLYLYGLAMVEAHKAVVLTYLEPLSAAIMGAVFLEQLLGPIDILGGALIVISGYIVAKA